MSATTLEVNKQDRARAIDAARQLSRRDQTDYLVFWDQRAEAYDACPDTPENRRSFTGSYAVVKPDGSISYR